MTDQNSPPAPAAPEPAKPPARNRILHWVRIVIAVVILGNFAIYAINKFVTRNDLSGCDSEEAKNGLSDVFTSKSVQAKRYNEIKTVSTSKEEVLCTASLTLEDESILEIDYRLYFENKGQMVQITAAREKPKA